MAPQYAEHLGKCYSFSGGQIENIARKRTVSKILNGTEPTLAQLELFCKEESASLHNCSSRRIGF